MSAPDINELIARYARPLQKDNERLQARVDKLTAQSERAETADSFSPGLSTTPGRYAGQTRFLTDVGRPACWSGDDWRLLDEGGGSSGAHTHPASEITDFDTEVGNHTDVAANSAARHMGDTATHNALGIDADKLDGKHAAAFALAAHTHAQLHGRQHGIDSGDDHTGVSAATEDNLVAFDANGLPKDSGYRVDDGAETSSNLWSAAKIANEIGGGGGGGDVPTGMIGMWATDTAPSGYLLCYGQAVNRTTYSDLFGVIGTTFGAGDGSTTFNLPDMRGRFPLGQDDMGGTSANRVTAAAADSIGGASGEESHLTVRAESAGSTLHNASPHDITVAYPGGMYIDRNGGTAHNNMPPYLTLNFIIKT